MQFLSLRIVCVFVRMRACAHGGCLRVCVLMGAVQGLGDVERLTADQWMRQVVCVPVPERMVRESASGPSLATSTSCVSVPNSAEGSEDEEQEDV